MAYSSSWATTPPPISSDIEFDNERRIFHQSLLDEGHVYLPDSYYARFVHHGIADELINLVVIVNGERKEERKRLADKIPEIQEKGKEQLKNIKKMKKKTDENEQKKNLSKT